MFHKSPPSIEITLIGEKLHFVSSPLSLVKEFSLLDTEAMAMCLKACLLAQNKQILLLNNKGGQNSWYKTCRERREKRNLYRLVFSKLSLNS